MDFWFARELDRDREMQRQVRYRGFLDKLTERSERRCLAVYDLERVQQQSRRHSLLPRKGSLPEGCQCCNLSDFCRIKVF